MVAKNELEHRHVDWARLPGEPVVYVIKSVQETEAIPIASALVVRDEDSGGILWHIHTEPEYRRRGYALDLLRAIQQTCDYIRTSWTSEEGKALCLKAGFRLQGPQAPGQLPLVWERGESDAVEEGEQQKGDQ